MVKKVIAVYILIISFVLMLISRHYFPEWGVLSMIPIGAIGYYFYGKLMKESRHENS
ncbi:hypothetical protein ACWIWA_11200 [Ursidibacter arcticus]|uniref:hypothetical protein n=1 Tax=Ursidibacter arcticus TaxID=1524965 RepID=UPI0012FCA16F|nr:hypothetical protein [Ursidibacter arcticus]